MKSKRNILLADDDFDYLLQVKFRLESAGFEVITANSQKEAEALIETTDYEAAVFDLMMENHDSGFILSYKSKKIKPNIPVIISTAVTSETGMSFEENNDWVKADLYLEKGAESEKIAEYVNNLINEKL